MPWNHGNLEIFDRCMRTNQSLWAMGSSGNQETHGNQDMFTAGCDLGVLPCCPPAGSSELVSAAVEAVAAMGKPATVGYINCGL